MLGRAMPSSEPVAGPDDDDGEEKKRKRKKKKDEPDAQHELEMTQALKEERELKEQKRLQAAAGLISEAAVDRLDWIYEQGSEKVDDTELMNQVAEIEKKRKRKKKKDEPDAQHE